MSRRPDLRFAPTDQDLAFELYAILNAASRSGLLKNFLNIDHEEAHKVQDSLQNSVE